MEVVPKNAIERVFCVIVIFLGMVAFSCFISSITQAMASLQRIHAERDKQLCNMRYYISQNHVSFELGHMITSFSRANLATKRRVHEDDVQMFKLLPDSVRRKLHREVHEPVLSRHPLLKQSVSLDDIFMQEVCHTAMSEISLGRAEELFCPGQEALCMYFTISGAWEYCRRGKHRRLSIQSAIKKISSASRASSLRLRKEEELQELEKQEEDEEDEVLDDVIDVCEDAFICEVALWLQWELKGCMVSRTRCECVSLNAVKFRKIVCISNAVHIAFREYARFFHKWLQSHSVDAEVGFTMDKVQEIMREALIITEMDAFHSGLSWGRFPSVLGSWSNLKWWRNTFGGS